MAKTEQNLKTVEAFICEVLAKNFNQKVDPEKLRQAAEKLLEALPDKQKKAA